MCWPFSDPAHKADASSKRKTTHMSKPQKRRLPFPEYVALVAMLSSIVAMATDMMLPALGAIGHAFNVAHENDVHYIVTVFFFGMASGQLIVGPLSDTFGRKPVILAGYVIFVIGCVLSIIASSWTMMLCARFLQGVGASAPRVVALALVRDEYEGRKMAQILSITSAIFILVPMIAPALGQALLYFGDWSTSFWGLIALSIFVCIWFFLRQPETLTIEDRRPFRVGVLATGLKEILSTRIAVGYTLTVALIYGAFIGYLGAAQQIFAEVFDQAALFVLYFALTSAAIGVASLVNASLVMRFGMRRLTGLALIGQTTLSLGFCVVLLGYDGVPPLYLFLTWQMCSFFCIGLTFGNLNALALEPLGQIAGLGAAFVGSLSIILSLPLAALAGALFDGTVMPLVSSFGGLGFLACLLMLWTGRAQPD